MTKNNYVENIKSMIFVFVCSIPLVLLLFQPISGDLSIYLQGARTIIEGRQLYLDFLDLKPPAFYYLYVIIEFISHGNEVIIRLFEYLMQLCTVFILYTIIMDKFKEKRFAGIVIFIYSLSYSVLGYSNYLHGESWFNLLILMVLLFQTKQNSNYNTIMIGIITGIIISIKYSFGIIVLPLLLFDIIIKENSIKSIIRKHLIILFISIIIVGLSFIVLLNSNMYSDYLEVINYLKYYSSQPPFGLNTIKSLIEGISIFFADNYSLFFSFLIPISFLTIIKQRSTLSLKQKQFIILNFLMLCFLFLSVVIERKLVVFHFIRIYPFLTFFISYSIMELIDTYKKLGKINEYLHIIIVAVTISFVIVFSPISRFINYLPTVYYKIFNEEKFDEFYTKSGDSIILRKVYKNINLYLEKFENQQIILVSIGGNLINYNIKNNRVSKFSQSTFYFSNANIQKWKNEIVEEFRTANLIIIQTNDNHPILNGHNFTSMEMVERTAKLNELLNLKFELDTTIEPFKIFKNKSTVKASDK